MQINPVVVRVIEGVDAPTPETTIADLLLGSVWFVGFVLLLALAAGLVSGGIFILVRKVRERLGGEIAPPSPSPLTRG
jgi:hypothetical protein